jgi:hypothetical protein
MTKKLSGRGRHTVLPIVGDALVEVRLSTRSLPALVFRAADGSESELRIADRLSLRRGECERVLEGSQPGATFNPKELSPLLELLGGEVRDAVAEEEGRLRVVFANQLVLEATPSADGEAWHFQYPRPGHPPGGKVGQFVALTGAPGRLI